MITKSKTMDHWLGVVFESSSATTEQFAKFARDLKSYVKSELYDEGLELVSFSRGHFEVSGFVKNLVTGNIAYFSCSDVRYFRNDWHEHLLIRTAKHEKDYTGGSNGWTTLDDLAYLARRITE